MLQMGYSFFVAVVGFYVYIMINQADVSSFAGP
jgi:hypothetical protein